MTTRERMESAETALYRAIAKRRDPATLKCCIDELVTAALAAGVEAERLHMSQKSEGAHQKIDTENASNPAEWRDECIRNLMVLGKSATE